MNGLFLEAVSTTEKAEEKTVGEMAGNRDQADKRTGENLKGKLNCPKVTTLECHCHMTLVSMHLTFYQGLNKCWRVARGKA